MLKRLIKWLKAKVLRIRHNPCRETMVWIEQGSRGRDQVGREVNIDGRKGKVVGGSILFVEVEWDQ